MKIGIVGLGLMGGSIAKALSGNEIMAFDDRKESLEKALEEGIITKYTLEINNEFEDLDIIFICTPVKYICGYVKKVSKYVKKDCIITDIGSTKNYIVTKVERYFPDINFVGAHPMAGSEKIGYDNSSKHLFENTYYLVTKTENTKETSIEILCGIIKRLKAFPIVIDPEEHDYIISIISHIPHIVASTLVNLVQVQEINDKMKILASGGFKDTTRVASSSPEMWQSICVQNKQEILKGIQSFKVILSGFEKSLIDEDEEKIIEYFKNAKNYRDNIMGVKS